MSTSTESGSSRRPAPMHGRVCYLQIPARDVGASADFYERIFGWRVDRGHGSFETSDPGMMGQWVTDRAPARDAAEGVLAWFNVDRIEETLAAAKSGGGAVVEVPTPDGPRMLAKIRDPAGNVVGVVQHGKG